MNVFKGPQKTFEASQRSVKIEIQVNFEFNTTFWNPRGGKVNVNSGDTVGTFIHFHSTFDGKYLFKLSRRRYSVFIVGSGQVFMHGDQNQYLILVILIKICICI